MDSSHDDEQDEIPPSSSENTIENDEILDMKDEKWDTFQKSTFKNALQAKKRLQAFGQQKQLLISPSTKSRTSITEKSPNEQPETHDVVSPTKLKKENPIDKAKATIEEIELLKRSEFGFLPVTNNERKMLRSRSKSSDGDFIFRKRERKIRNYRRSDNARRSPSPLITTARNKHTDKSKNKYPKNWEEFVKDNWTYEKLASKGSHSKVKSSNTSNDIFRHLLFDSPAEIIKPYHFKNDRGDDIKVPFKYLRYTLTKPKVAFNVNMFKVKEQFLNRKQVLDRTTKENKAILEKFYKRTTKRFKTSEPLGQRNWYLKNWRDSDSKIQETSIGLSFLQTYSDDDEEEEQILADSISELNEKNLGKKESRDEGKNETLLMENDYNEFNLTVDPKMEDSVIKEDRKKKANREFTSPVRQKNRTITDSMNKNMKKEENMSWTPERKVFTSEDLWQESPKVKNEIMTPEEKNSEKAENKIPSDDEWAETPERKSQETDKEKKKKKKMKQKSTSDSPSGSKKLKKKKKKLDKKKKQRDKEKKARKKEKLKAERLKKEKKKEKEKEKEKKKEILKKLKKEFRQSIEEKKKKTPSVENLVDLPVKVKIEKEDMDERVVTPVEDLRNFLNQKEKDHQENIEKVDDTTVPKNDDIVELFSVNVKQEKINDDKKRKKEEKTEEIIKEYKKIEEALKYDKNDEETLLDTKIIEQTLKKDEDKELILDLENKPSEKVKSGKKNKKEEQEIIGRVTPDTEEYQSNWESDDGISPIVKLGSKKSSRGWESDEEVFERAFAKKEKTDVPFRESPILEMPLDIKKFPRRNFSRPEKKRSRTRSPEYLDMDEEIKRLEAERINLSKERMQLEMEKIRIHELEREKSMEEMAHMPGEDLPSEWHKKQQNRDKWHAKDESIDSTSRDRREKQTHSSKNKDKVNETASTSIDSNKSRSGSILSIHSSPEITSTKSPNRTGLENAYQEFMRAVSGGTETKDIVISSTDSEPQVVETSNRSKVRYSKSRRDRKKGRSVDIMEEKQEEKVLSTTDPKILEEILLPGEIPLPDIPIPLPVPVPSPKLDLPQNILSTSGGSSIQAISLQSPAAGNQSAQESVDNQQYSSDNSTPMRPFSFSTLVISSKKPALLEKTKWKVDDDSDEELAPKKKLEEMMTEQEVTEESFKDQNEDKVRSNEKKEASEKPEPKVEVKVTEKRDKDKRDETDNKREQGKSVKRKNSRSRSPLDTSRDKRRREDDTRRREDDTRRREDDTKRREDDTRRRENDTRRREDDSRRKEEEPRRREDTKRRDDFKRRDSGNKRVEEVGRREGEDGKRRDRNKRPSPPRHRETSPRRRRLSSPMHRRSSPRQRSPARRNELSRKPERSDRRSPQRSSPAKRRRSYSPAKPSPALRRRSPSHYDRISKSPRRSPMEGLKRSVADSTISDDLLPQPYPTESSNSPLCSSTPAPPSRKTRFNLSPKRPSLDERINQVLGIESQQQAQPVWKPPENCQVDPRQSAAYPGYHHHNVTADLGLASSAPATSSKVLQVGNIIQVVPSEDFGALPPQPVQAPAVQKIVQVGNMLQIVPSDMEPIITPQLPAIETVVPMEQSVVVSAIPERRSAEDVLAGRMAERDRKKQEKEDRRREKERKRKEKDKKKKMRLKVSTEEMIKRALELDGYIGTDGEDPSSLVPEVINDTPGLDPSRSILSTSTSRFSESTVKTEKERKSVQFADGVRPGEGTSPSGGEELSSPPPQSDVLVKPKKYKRLGSVKKKKRKVKVKVIKKRHIPPPPATDSDEEFENLPPPSPPPGSPPPHVFPVRAKVHTINNIPQHYLPSYGITTAPQTPPVVQPQPRMSLAFQTPPTAMYRTPPPNVVGQHYSRLSHAPPMGMNVPPPPTSIHRDQQPYGSF